MLTIYYDGRKKEVYKKVEKELNLNISFADNLVDIYINELDENGVTDDELAKYPVEKDKINKMLMKLIKRDIRSCFKDCYNSKLGLCNSSKYRGAVRLSNHSNTSNLCSCSSTNFEIKIIW